jgi:predicted TPR repeat methyltransferase
MLPQWRSFQVLTEMGDHWQAVRSATRATELRPHWADAHLTLARAQLEYGEPQLALHSYKAVLLLQVMVAVCC